MTSTATIPKQAMEALARLGFIDGTGIVSVIDKAGNPHVKRYWIKHSVRPIVLFTSESGVSWFYNTEHEQWVHPDRLHAHIEWLSAKR